MSLDRYRLFRWRRSPPVLLEPSLEQVFAGCLQWTYDHRSRFFPFVSSGRPAGLGVKAFGELAFCLGFVLRVAPDRLRSRATPLGHWVLDTVDSNAFGALLAEEPQLLPMLDALEVLEAELGVTGRLAALPTRPHLACHSDAQRVDALPFQTLGTLKSCGALPAEIERTFRRTLACHDPHLACMSDLDVYAVTHTLFHLSGVVDELPPWLDEATLSEMRWTIEVLLGMALRSHDLDLLAELLICHSILRCADARVAGAAWRRLAKAQLRSGLIPGPEHDAERLASLDKSEAIELGFLTAYHTTLATLLAASLFLVRPVLRAGRPRPS